MIEIEIEKNTHMPKIYVIGIGGGGNNAVDRMIDAGLKNVKYMSINTDFDVLESCKAETILQIGRKVTGGYGAGTDPIVGAAAAEESEDEIRSAVSDANMVILTCGLGGGTGTGAIPVVAKLCHEAGILTVAVVTLPFTFEGLPRKQAALQGLTNLSKVVDTLLVIPNDKLLTLSERQFFLEDAFVMADNVLKYTIQGITNIIFNKGTVNLDFNDITTLLKNKGLAHLGIGIVEEGGSLLDAVKQALNSPLLETDIKNSTTLMINTSGRINLLELNEAIGFIQSMANPNTNIIWGTVTDDETVKNNSIVVTLIASGLEMPSVEPPTPKPEKSQSRTQSSRSSLLAPELRALEVPPFLKGYTTAANK